MKNEKVYRYDIAISFAGEDRHVAEKIARLLKQRSVSVFYDDYEKADLWGKDLYEYLASVYSTYARYCIMLISAHYAKKLWTNHERSNAQERAFREHKEYILPVKLDDTVIPGVRNTIGYIDLRKTSVEDLVDLAQRKLGKSEVSTPTLSNEARMDIPIPKLKKQFTDRERDRYVKETFSFIGDYFKMALNELEKHHREIETDFTSVHDLKFLSKVYVNGTTKCECKVWLGGFGFSPSVKYLEGRGLGIDNDGTYNESFSIEDDGFEIYIKPTFFMNLGRESQPKERMDQRAAAEYLWKRFISALEQ